MLKKNDVIELVIEDVNNMGFGIGRYDGAVVFVTAAVTGDKLRVKIIKSAKNYYVARIEEILVPSKHRSKNPCPVASKCGGCSFSHIEYEYERELKRNFVIDAFRRAGLDGIEVLPVKGTGKDCQYRNKIQYPVSEKGKFGYYAPYSHRIVEFDACNLHDKAFDRILNYISEFLIENNISIYDENTHKGLVRHIYLRNAKKAGQVLVCVVINGETLPHSDDFTRGIVERFPEVKSVQLNINTEKTNVILGDKFKVLMGTPYIEDYIGEVKFKISAKSFYQINHDCTELLYSYVNELADARDNDKVCDLFCGTGTIGLYIAKNNPTITLTGVEIVSEAVEDAKENAKLNNIANASFVVGDANTSQIEDADIIVVDPPRKGCEAELISRICEISPRKVIYVSCDPNTLARDLVLFREKGYTTTTAQPFDMFPRTGHVECVVLITRNM